MWIKGDLKAKVLYTSTFKVPLPTSSFAKLTIYSNIKS